MEAGHIILFVFFIWLVVLSLLMLWMVRFFNKLTKEVNKGNIVKILENVLIKEKDNSKGLEDLSKYVARVEDEARYHIQKVGIIRFNPFKELGGDHSFSLALVDGKDNGFVVTGLHTRERTRVYAKVVKKGKSEVELSSEESKAVKLALK